MVDNPDEEATRTTQEPAEQPEETPTEETTGDTDEAASAAADTLVAVAATATDDAADNGGSDTASDTAVSLEVAAPIEDAKDGTPTVTVGRIVHVALDRGAGTGDCRPAIVVRVWNPEMINAQMFTDGLNDHMDYAGGIAWKTSLHYEKPIAGQPPTPNTWHWSWED